jgi:hypothetical protein
MTALSSFSASSKALPFQTRGEKLGLGWFRFPNEEPVHRLFALFHTMTDMMTVILRIGGRSTFDPIPQGRIVLDSLNDLISMHIQLAAVT